MPDQVCQRVNDHDGGFRVLMEPIEDVRRPEAYLDLVRSRQIDGLWATTIFPTSAI